jgi:hypothetical protein
MPKPPDTAAVHAVVEGEWGLAGATVTDHHGGMNSATGDLTGISSPEGNTKGLDDAERLLVGPGLSGHSWK